MYAEYIYYMWNPSIFTFKQSERCETEKRGKLNTFICIKLSLEELVIGCKEEMSTATINVSVKKQHIFNILFY